MCVFPERTKESKLVCQIYLGIVFIIHTLLSIDAFKYSLAKLDFLVLHLFLEKMVAHILTNTIRNRIAEWDLIF